jgi:hypothetical protein
MTTLRRPSAFDPSAEQFWVTWASGAGRSLWGARLFAVDIVASAVTHLI